ncbi:MAG: FkbM family methyltransferase [Aphanizomenon flos-aquae CP01]|jgi:FkbM family methyltransferase|nr:FkbM family methyltransferase [Aphanizomenon flos-aquae CP01]
MNFKQILHYIQHNLAKSKLGTDLAIKLRNQCNCIIAYHLAETSDHHENGELWLIKRIAPNCSTFIDVGAYIGDWTECFLNSARQGCLGLVFEPGESAFQQIEKKFSNNLNLTLIQSACSDTIGETIFYDIYPMQSSSLTKYKQNSDIMKTKTVKVSTIDQEIKNRNWDSIDFLKVDCEGYDLQVLRGSKEVLSQQKVGIIQFEYGEYWARSGSTLLSCFEFLNSFQYEIFLLGKNGLLKFNYELYGEYFRYSNFVAIAQNQMDTYRELIKGVA